MESRSKLWRHGVSAACLSVAGLAGGAAAQDRPATGDARPPAPTEVPAPANPVPVADRQVYTPADFVRFAPRNALDMLQQVPGFTILSSEQLRGLGQATGNVLFNGQRPSSKSDDITVQLARIPANNVTRIEIVDGATLDVPGLSGQVANIIVRADALSGQFAWRPNFRAHYTRFNFLQGEVSVSGRAGPVQYEVGLANNGGVGGAGGPTIITNAAGTVTEVRDDRFRATIDEPKLSGRATFDGPGTMIANLNASYQRIYDRYYEEGSRSSPGLPVRLRTVRQQADSWNREFGGDIEFAIGPGRLKLIGLDRFSNEPYRQTIVTSFADGAPTIGDRYAQTGKLKETIGRAEYGWKMLGGDWQLSGEAAFNSLANAAELATLDATTGAFVTIPYPEGTGGVDEDRYEALLSYSRPIGRTLSLQIVGGAERSTIAQTGPGGLTRSFFRPKGTVSLAWKPSADFDLSAKLRRRVLQLSFYDFLARVFLDNETENSSNADLVPQQDWSLEIEANRRLGAWGSTKVRLIYRDVQDYIDIVPVGLTGEAVGNIPRAKAGAIDWTSTIQFDPVGWKGAKLDARVLLQRSSLDDPLTGRNRQYSAFTDALLTATLRHDVPKSDWAYGGTLEYTHLQPRYRLNEIDRQYEGPVWASLFVENKDVMGLTLRAGINNLLNARSRRERVVYAGRRNTAGVAFEEYRDRLIGPIFQFSARGTF